MASTTISQLLSADIEQDIALCRRYYQSSNLPNGEKRKHAPNYMQFRRDKVMAKLMWLESQVAVKKFTLQHSGDFMGSD